PLAGPDRPQKSPAHQGRGLGARRPKAHLARFFRSALAVHALHVVHAAGLGIAGHRVATLLGSLVVGIVLFCIGVLAGFCHVCLPLGSAVSRLGLGCGHLGIFLGLHVSGLRILHAYVLGVALEIVALFFSDVIS